MSGQEYLGEILVRHGVVPPDRLPGLFETVREKGQQLTDLIVSSNLADEARIAQALADECGVEYVPRIDIDAVPLAVASRIPITYAKQHRILPVAEEDGIVRCVLADPLDTVAIDDVRAVFGKPVEIVVSTNEAVINSINRVWEKKEDGGGQLEGDAALEEDNLVDIIDSDDDAPIIAWVNGLFAQAVRERASDIHIEPEERDVVVRYRIDGELYVAKRASKQFMAPIVARVKIAGKSVDIRVSTIPTSRGFERIVMRILHKASVLFGLDELGFSGRDLGLMEQLIQKPDGIILVTGPTGSGKTTTLYACLNKINDPSRNILTAEDPVEYEIGGIHQVHVHPGIGLTFASALRAFLRQDPDVIMVGEIRDKETAEIAIHASLTGHLVLSTIHTNDAPGAVTRLVEMDIEPFLVRSTVIGILAQRLVRILCDCKIAYKPTDYELTQLGLDEERRGWKARRPISPRYVVHGQSYRFVGHDISPDTVFYKAGGCDACNNKGFIGRRGIYELMIVDDAVGPLILKSADAQTIKRAAIAHGMDTLRDDGARKVLMGLTTVEEVLAATQEDVVVDE